MQMTLHPPYGGLQRQTRPLTEDSQMTLMSFRSMFWAVLLGSPLFCDPMQ